MSPVTSINLTILVVMHICHHAPHHTIFHHTHTLPQNVSSTFLRFCHAYDAAVSIVPSSLPPLYSSPLPSTIPFYPSFRISSSHCSTSSTSVFDFPASPIPSSSYTPLFVYPESLLYSIRKPVDTISIAARHFPFTNNILSVQL